MFDDAEDGTRRAVAAETTLTPVAVPAGQVDFAGYPTPDPLCIGAGDRNHFAYELMSRSSGEAIVAALQFEVGGTYSGG
jgi:hypothetical protein